ncbi:MAG: DUF2069 domain-containing protein [Xanthomonadaceae bacterium]|nr:DUF2069 domain-containing protein [Xanthomonadaceae bacterium]
MSDAGTRAPNDALRWSPLKRAAVASVFALWLLHGLWHAWWLPAPGAILWLVLVLAALPGLPCVLAALWRRPSAPFWAGVAGLFYFSHGVMEAWAAEQWRALGWIEVALALLAVFGSSLEGARARSASKRAARAR